MQLTDLARNAVETYIKEEKKITPPSELEGRFLNESSGVFVSIFKEGNLRACIGTYLPTQENIAEEVISAAIAAATEDYRFGPIQEEELPSLTYTVYIIKEPQPVKEIEELDPQKYGIIIRNFPEDEEQSDSNPKSALLLPGLEDIDTIEKQLAAVCQKAGIEPRKEKIGIYKFEAEKQGEKE